MTSLSVAARPAAIRATIGPVDIDGFIATHHTGWERLDELVAGAQRGRRLSAEELDELVRGYERTSTHLSIARTRYGDRALTTDQTRRVGRARALFYGAPPGTWHWTQLAMR